MDRPFGPRATAASRPSAWAMLWRPFGTRGRLVLPARRGDPRGPVAKRRHSIAQGASPRYSDSGPSPARPIVLAFLGGVEEPTGTETETGEAPAITTTGSDVRPRSRVSGGPDGVVFFSVLPRSPGARLATPLEGLVRIGRETYWAASGATSGARACRVAGDASGALGAVDSGLGVTPPSPTPATMVGGSRGPACGNQRRTTPVPTTSRSRAAPAATGTQAVRLGTRRARGTSASVVRSDPLSGRLSRPARRARATPAAR